MVRLVRWVRTASALLLAVLEVPLSSPESMALEVLPRSSPHLPALCALCPCPQCLSRALFGTCSGPPEARDFDSTPSFESKKLIYLTILNRYWTNIKIFIQMKIWIQYVSWCELYLCICCISLSVSNGENLSLPMTPWPFLQAFALLFGTLPQGPPKSPKTPRKLLH